MTTKTSEIVLHILNNILFIEVFVITFETKYVWIRIFFLKCSRYLKDGYEMLVEV